MSPGGQAGGAPSSTESLKYVLAIDPDVAAVEKAFGDLAKGADKDGKEGGKLFGEGFFKTFKDVAKSGAGLAKSVGGAALGGLSSGLGLAMDPTSALGPFKEVTRTLTDFAAKASPVTMRQWTMALDDAQAVIGRTFVPVLELMTKALRMFGDTLANLLPNMGEVRGALTEFRESFDDMGKALRSVLAEIGPSIREVLIGGLKQLGHWLAVVAKAVTHALNAFRGGLGGPSAPTRTSLGAAISNPSQLIGHAEAGTQSALAAYSMGRGDTADERSAKSLESLVEIERQSFELFRAANDYYQLAKPAVTGILQGMEFLVKAVVDLARIGTAISNLVGKMIPESVAEATARMMGAGSDDLHLELNSGAKKTLYGEGPSTATSRLHHGR